VTPTRTPRPFSTLEASFSRCTDAVMSATLPLAPLAPGRSFETLWRLAEQCPKTWLSSAGRTRPCFRPTALPLALYNKASAGTGK